MLIGQPRKRVEDWPLLLGAGRFTDDLRPDGVLHVQVIRSPHAHARVRRLDVSRARQAPGVVDVVTAEDTGALGHLSGNPMLPGIRFAPYPVLVGDIVRAVGEPVAAVVADTAARARDAAEAVTLELEPLPPLVAPEAAAGDGAVLYPELATNRAVGASWRVGDVDAAFARAAAVARVRVEQPRLAAVAMEPRSVLASYDPIAGALTVWLSTQAPFRMRAELAGVLGIPENHIRVIAPDVGGGFGVKGDPYRDEVLTAWLAWRLRRPVKWIATRTEDVLTTKHGRGGNAEGELAVAADGTILGVRARIVYALGSHYMFNSTAPIWNHGRLIPSAYVVPAVDIESAGVYTTTAPTGPYRGAGRPEGVFLMERLLDEAARTLGIDPPEIRRRNFVPATAFPYRNVVGFTYDSGDYAAALDRALALARYDDLRKAQGQARERGQIVGVGLASYVENAALGWESGSVRIERTGVVTVVTGSSAHGQGHETTWAQIVGDVLGVEPAAVSVQHGDTRGVAQGFGTFGSRSTALGGSAVFRAAAQIRDKGRRIAANLLEAGVDDVTPVAGGFQVVGLPTRVVTWRQVADAAYRGTHLAPGDDPGLDATVFFKADGETWSFGTCVVTVAIDRATGRVTLTRCVWVDDAGTIINPLLAEGQLHGSYAQGVGQALLEGIVYDGEGQLLTATLMDYAVPRADDFPEPVLDKTVTPSPRNPLGAKGLGEAGCIALPPAIVNGVVDALAPYGCRHLDMPVSPEKVWRIVHDA